MASSRLAKSIISTAERIGIDPQDLATVISYETAGTFDEWKAGPVTQHGRHSGLIQWGQPQQKRYGVYEGMPVEDQLDAVGKYLVDAGVSSGMGLLNIYAAINAGQASKIHASDANNGGAPGTVMDKVNDQMEGHKAKAAALLGGEYIPAPFNPAADRVNRDNASIDYGDNSDSRSSKPVTIQQQYEQEQAAPKPYSFTEAMGGAVHNDWYTTWAIRRMSEGVIDPDWQGVGNDRGKQIQDTLDPKYHEYVFGASSEENLLTRLKYAQMAEEDQARQSVSGWGAFGARLATGIADPITTPLMIGSGGVGTAAKLGLGTVGKVAIGSLVGGATNFAVDMTAREAFDDPNTDPLYAAGVGVFLGGLGGALFRNAPASPVDSLRTTTALSSPQAIEQAPIGTNAGSAGAARVHGLQSDVIADNLFLGQADVPTGFGGRLRLDVTGQMTTSDIPEERLVGALLGEDSAGFTDHSVVQHSVATRAVALDRKLSGNLNVEYSAALRGYLDEQGASMWRPFERARAIQQFHRDVGAWIEDPNPSPAISSSVARGGAATRKYLAAYAEKIKASGLSDLQIDPHYVPKIADHDAVAAFAQRFDDDQVHQLLVAGIQHKFADIETSVAKKIAQGYWRNIQRAGYGGVDEMQMAVSLGDREAFKRGLLGELADTDIVSATELDKAFDVINGTVDENAPKRPDGSKGLARLKSRTPMDYTFSGMIRNKAGQLEEVSINDLYNKDLAFVARRYGRTMSGRIAFAETQVRHPRTGELILDGIRSKGDFEKLRNFVREAYRKSSGDRSAKEGKMENFEANAEFMWSRINGIPVQGSQTAFAQGIRRIKALEFIRLMSNMGFNQAQESWKLVSTLGARAALKGMPSIREAFQHAQTSATAKDRMLVELQHMTGIGQEDAFGNMAARSADDRLGASSSRLWGVIDDGLNLGKKLTANMSFMSSIQGYQKNWALKSIMHQLAEVANQTEVRAADGTTTFDFSKLGDSGWSKERARFASIGLGEDSARLLFSNLLKHGEFDEKGTLTFLNTHKWDPKAVTEAGYVINRYVDRIIQQNDFGGLSKWMSQPALSMMAQFRNFTYGAWAKSTLYSVNHFDPRAMVLLMGEMVAATATGVLRTGIAASVGSEEDREQWLENVSDPAYLLKSGIARSASASIIPMVIDTGLLATPAGPQFGNLRSSGQPTDAFLGAPALSHATEIFKSSRSLLDSIWEDRDLSQTEIRTMARALPVPTNFAPFAGLLNLMIEDKAKYAPRD